MKLNDYLTNMFQDLTKNYPKGWSDITAESMAELVENNGCEEEQIEKWGKLIIQNDRRKEYKSYFPEFDYIKDCFFLAIKKEDTEDRFEYTDHYYMLKYCETMPIKNIVELNQQMHDISMGRLKNPWSQQEYEFMSCGFWTFWQPLLTEISNIDLVHGHEGIKNFENHLRLVKNCIINKERFKPFWDESLREKLIEQSLALTEQITKQFPSKRSKT